MIKNGLKHIADFYRTAPYGETWALFSAGSVFLTYDNPLLFVAIMGGTLGGIDSVKNQFKLRKRLEKSVSEHGYNNSVFERTIPNWCDRQTARVVARNCGHLDSYVDLYRNNKKQIILSDLPNF